MVIAVIFGALIGEMTEEETGGSMWTGKVTIYYFFTGVIYPAIAIFLRHALRQRSYVAWGLFGLAMVSPLQSVIFAGRREATAQVLLTIGLTLFFQRRVTAPRWMVALAAASAMLIIPATGTYRAIASTREWDDVKQMDLVGNFQEFINNESILELRNAAMYIHATESLGNYGLGVAYWDELVWRFVPAQIVGNDLKKFLLVARDDQDFDNEFARAGFMISVGSTITGMGDSYSQFGYFGALVFGLMGHFFRRLWTGACESGGIFTQLLYIGSVTSAMRAVTHQTSDFLPGVVYQLIFLACLYFWVRKPTAPKPSGIGTPSGGPAMDAEVRA